MANTRELRRRIKSIKNTSQITHAMEMVAAVKMRKAQSQAVWGRPYSENLNQALVRLLSDVDVEGQPLLSPNQSKKAGVILLSTDKGLVGALNTNLFRKILGSDVLSGNVIFYTVGRKGRSFVIRTGKELAADFDNPDTVTFRQAVQLSKLAIEDFLQSKTGEAHLVYPRFVSTTRQEPIKVKLLPIDLTSLGVVMAFEQQVDGEFIYEPTIDALLDFVLIHHIRIRIYQALLETKACEHSSRMVSMKNATDNAMELIEDLTLTYNQTRQDAITKEILEIATASAAME